MTGDITEKNHQTMAMQTPTRALLLNVVTTATGPDGVSYSVAYVLDPDGDRHLVFASTTHFGDLECLPLMQHCEISLTGDQPCLEVLPLHLQSEEVQHSVSEKIRLLSLAGQALATELAPSRP